MIVRGWNFDTTRLAKHRQFGRHLWLLKYVNPRHRQCVNGRVLASGRYVAAETGTHAIQKVVAWATSKPDIDNLPDDNGDLV